jgi:hypothetical protein
MEYSTNHAKRKGMEIVQDTSQKAQDDSQKAQTKGQESEQDKNLFADKIRNHKPKHNKDPISPQQLTEQIRFQQKLAQKEHDLPEWQKRDDSIRKRHGTWNPTKKLSRQQMQDIRNLSDQMPHLKTIDLANYYQVSPEAIRRILASTWVPKESEEDSILERGQRRKEQRRSLKNTMAINIEDARRKLTYAKSVRLADVKIDAPRTEHAASSLSKNLQNRFRENGKIKYDSNNNHGYYNKKGKEKTRRRPYSPSVGDIID